MKRFHYALLLLIFTVMSCGKNGLYISVDNTVWEISTSSQVAWPCYHDDMNVSIIQKNFETHRFQTLNGTFSVKGHRVNVDADGNSVLMVRTFSHLKNSSNKNYSSKYPSNPPTLGGSIWATLKDGDFHFTYFRADGTLVEGTHENVAHQEGLDYGWSWTTGAYQVNGYKLQAGETTGTFYGSDFLRLTDSCLACVSTCENQEGTSSLKGTVWTYETRSYPGFIFFTSATEFTRVLVLSKLVFDTMQGTYTLKGNSLELVGDSWELDRTCTISDGQFEYLERTYSLVTSF